MENREPRQVRKEAAVSESFHVPRGCLVTSEVDCIQSFLIIAIIAFLHTLAYNGFRIANTCREV